MNSKQTIVPDEYPDFIRGLKERIRTAQVRAGLAVNRELVLLYWSIGKDILERQQKAGWGAKVVDRIAADLRTAFPEMKGLSPRNLNYMKTFAQIWPEEAIVQQVVAQLPWGHNIRLIDRIDSAAERRWYAEQCIQNGWSRSVLVHQIESGLFQRQGKAMTNFDRTLLAPQSELAQQILKDPYNFDFLALEPDIRERELERGLIGHLRDFILELGKGFAFVGSQYHLEVGGQDFYLDLLFYHLRLRCFVVVDLKIEDFKPEFAGKMNFYLSATDELLRQAGDAPSIGIIMCKGRNEVIVEYALRDTTKPMGVTQYQLTHALPEKLRQQLPTSEDLEEEYPLLLLAGLRIELEQELRRLLEDLSSPGLKRSMSLRNVIEELVFHRLLSRELADKLNAIFDALNSAVHGHEIRTNEAQVALAEGSMLLEQIKNVNRERTA